MHSPDDVDAYIAAAPERARGSLSLMAVPNGCTLALPHPPVSTAGMR